MTYSRLCVLVVPVLLALPVRGEPPQSTPTPALEIRAAPDLRKLKTPPSSSVIELPPVGGVGHRLPRRDKTGAERDDLGFDTAPKAPSLLDQVSNWGRLRLKF